MRLIDADALEYTMLYKENWLRGTGVEAPAIWKTDVDAQPTVDAVPVLHGYWGEVKDSYFAGGGKTVCSQCRYGYSWKMYFEVERFNYCPNCGARMDRMQKGGFQCD